MNNFNYRFYCHFSSLLQGVSTILRKIPGAVKGKIVMFHHITNEFVDTIDSCKCTVNRFEEILIQLKEEGYKFITIDRLTELSRIKSNERFVVITFDDITEDMFLNAYPILKKMQVPFAIYVATGFINKIGFINDRQLDILNNEPLCTIGSHTISHPMLRYSKNSYNEIFQSKRILENRIGKPVDHFAYPYGKIGAVSLKNIRMAKEAGYKSAMGTIETDVFKYFKLYLWYLPRVVLK